MKVSGDQRHQPAVIVTATKPGWVSCQSISANLRQAYRHAFASNFNAFEVQPEMGDWDVFQLARKIAESQPERLIFLDHPPHPARLLKELARLYGTRPLPPLFIHVYGDFTIYTPSWIYIEPLLQKCRVTFLCASERQQSLIQDFVGPSSRSSVVVCPFQVNQEYFYFDPKLRLQMRKRLRVGTEERVFLYAGRISMQKNVIPMVQNFLAITAKSAIPSRLIVAGEFDDIGAPFFGVVPAKGQCYQQWVELRSKLSPTDLKRLHYVGNQSSANLLALYNASDIGISLSLHHDEDFGMAPIEGLFTGSRMILSDWGGYASFKDREEFCTTVETRLPPRDGGRSGLISKRSFANELKRHLNAPLDQKARADCADRYAQRFSIPSVARILKQIHALPAKKFAGFSERMKFHARAVLCSQSGGPPMFPLGMRRGSFYEDVYQAYLRKGISE